MLPKISNYIQAINIDSFLLEASLVTTTFTQLKKICLHLVSLESANNLFIDNNTLKNRLSHQIEIMVIKIKFVVEHNAIFDLSDLDDMVQKEEIRGILFKKCLTEYEHLKYLNFSSCVEDQPLTFIDPDLFKFSSNIFELHVLVDTLEDCLTILDAEFNQMKKFSIIICGRDCKPTFIHQNKNLPHLKAFSISYIKPMRDFYENELRFLLRRMINLQELNLNFLNNSHIMIDGYTLEKYFLSQQPSLRKLTFNIGSMISLNHLSHIPSNEDVRKTFENFQNNQIVSSIDYFPQKNDVYCHIYSCPFIWHSYQYITNHFPGGLFKSVRVISLYDEQPFEHEFFTRIAQSFPFVQQISVRNLERQTNINVQSSKIQWIHLNQIDLLYAHEDYLEQFLNHEKICLVNDTHFYANYGLLKKTTNEFTKDSFKINCLKIIRLVLANVTTDFDENVRNYFPYAQISC